MKKPVAAIGVFLIMAILMGCSMADGPLMDKTLLDDFINSELQTNEMTQRIVTALDKKDKQILRDALSPKALREADDLDEGIEYIFSIYEGSSTNIEFLANEGRDHYDSSGHKGNIQAGAIITTDENTYKLYYELWTVDDSDPSAKGIYRLTLVSIDEVDALFAPYVLEKEEAWEAGEATPRWNYGATYERPGIYHPGWDKSEPPQKSATASTPV
jgi:hypothetical protein